MKRLLLLFFGTMLSACAIGPGLLPRGYMVDGFAPSCLEVEIERLLLYGPDGQIKHGGSGQHGRGTVLEAGWDKRRVGDYAGGILIDDMDVPVKIYARWESLMEPQTYEATVIIPEEARRRMKTPAKSTCMTPNHPVYEIGGGAHVMYSKINIGLAPGGVVTVWASGPCPDDWTPPFLMQRTVGTVRKQGPYTISGKYIEPEDISKKCVADYGGIPFGSW